VLSLHNGPGLPVRAGFDLMRGRGRERERERERERSLVD